jgi:hypothetical protein
LVARRETQVDSFRAMQIMSDMPKAGSHQLQTRCKKSPSVGANCGKVNLR